MKLTALAKPSQAVCAPGKEKQPCILLCRISRLFLFCVNIIKTGFSHCRMFSQIVYNLYRKNQPAIPSKTGSDITSAILVCCCLPIFYIRNIARIIICTTPCKAKQQTNKCGNTNNLFNSVASVYIGFISDSKNCFTVLPVKTWPLPLFMFYIIKKQDPGKSLALFIRLYPMVITHFFANCRLCCHESLMTFTPPVKNLPHLICDSANRQNPYFTVRRNALKQP